MTDLEFTEKTTEKIKGEILDLAHDIWAHPELRNEEFHSTQILIDSLEKHGFSVKKNVCGRKTAFIASFGEGKPVIAYLGEYDALPGLSQEGGCPVHKPCIEGAPGHGCGHSALGTASLTAAYVAAAYLKENKLSGTIRYYGCCAEEGDGVKPYMARDGYFNDVDAVYAWHPASSNGVVNMIMAGGKTVIVNFKGRTAHAGATPFLGRSALDAAELTGVGVNYLREHVIPETRLQYGYLDAGDTAPNIVPDHASLMECVRAPRMSDVRSIMNRVMDIARGAALMTGTEVSFEPSMAYNDVRQNSVIAGILNEAAQEVGAPRWNEADKKLAYEFSQSFSEEQKAAQKQTIRQMAGDSADELLKGPLDPYMQPFNPSRTVYVTASSDVGDVCYVAPTANLSVATAAIGTPGHTWMMTGMVGSSIGDKGLLTAGKIMGLAGIKTLADPSRLVGAQEERIRQMGPYTCEMYKL